jgi:hypothetical protein
MASVCLTSTIIKKQRPAVGRLSRLPVKMPVICDVELTWKAGTVLSITWQCFRVQFDLDEQRV